jgi:dATP pyrophosphohydrolase
MPLISSTIVEVCVFKFEGDHPWYLLLKRSKDEKIYPGIWQFISGSIEGKEKAFEAALRELREETNITPERLWVVPHVSVFYDPSWDSTNLCPMFAAQVKPGVNPTLSSEHCEFGWFSFEDAHRKLVWHGQREGLKVVHDYIVRGEDAARLTRII